MLVCSVSCEVLNTSGFISGKLQCRNIITEQNWPMVKTKREKDETFGMVWRMGSIACRDCLSSIWCTLASSCFNIEVLYPIVEPQISHIVPSLYAKGKLTNRCHVPSVPIHHLSTPTHPRCLYNAGSGAFVGSCSIRSSSAILSLSNTQLTVNPNLCLFAVFPYLWPLNIQTHTH